MKNIENDKLQVSVLYDLWKKGRLNLQPEYQRSRVWSDLMRFNLIDTVIQGYPLGLVMLNVKMRPPSDSGTKESIEQFEVVDGQQRLSTLFEYKDASDWTQDEKRNRRLDFTPYADLPEDIQTKLDEYRIPIALLREYEDEEAMDIYSRLQHSKPLRIGEKVKAIHSPFKEQIKGLTVHKALHKYRARDEHWNLAAMFYRSAYEDNPLLRHEFSELESFFKNTSFDDKKATKAIDACNRTLNYIIKLMDEAKIIHPESVKLFDSARFMKWMFAVLYYLLPHYTLFSREHLAAEGAFEYWQVKDKESTPEWLAYMNTGRTGRTDTSQVKECLDQLSGYLINATDAEPKDPKRYFTREQRHQIYDKSDGQCASCAIQLSKTNFHADHIKPYSQGGKTEVCNGQALCAKCNWEKNKGLWLFEK